MTVVNEHPDVNVRKLYAGEVATQTGLPVADLVAIAARRRRDPSSGRSRRPPQRPRENAEFVAIDAAGPGLGLDRRLADRGAVRRRRPPPRVPRPGRGRRRPRRARSRRPTPTRGRSSSGPPSPISTSIAETEARNLIAAAVRRELVRRASAAIEAQIRDDAEARLQVEELGQPIRRGTAAEGLLGWLHRRMEQRQQGESEATPIPPPRIAEPRGRGSADPRRRRARVGRAHRAGPRRRHGPRRGGRARAAQRRARRATSSRRHGGAVRRGDQHRRGRSRHRRTTTTPGRRCADRASDALGRRRRRRAPAQPAPPQPGAPGRAAGRRLDVRRGAHVPARDRPGRPAHHRGRAAPGPAHRGRPPGGRPHRRRASTTTPSGAAWSASSRGASGPRAS